MSRSTHNGQLWTSSETGKLGSLAKKNTTTRVIGLKIGRTERAVHSQAQRQGTSLQPTNQSPHNRLRKK
jgi:hypothetical protein